MSRNDINFLLLLILCTLLSFRVYGQEHSVYGDTNIAKIKPIMIGKDYTVFNYDFKDNLSDGYWKFYSTNDSNKRDMSKYLKVEGAFKNGLREGKFKYYNLSGNKEGDTLPYVIIHYTQELFDGEVMYRPHKGYELFRGNYSNGNREGYFLWYFPKENNVIKKVEYYKAGELQQWVEYNKNGTIRSTGVGVQLKTK